MKTRYDTTALAATAGITLLTLGGIATAAKNDWAEGTPGIGKGATREFYNAAAFLPWKNPMGDWSDAKGAKQGNHAYATTRVIDDDTGKPVAWEVTGLVAEWVAGTHQNKGFFLRALEKGKTIKFASRESGEADQHSRLILDGDKGSVTLAPAADTHLSESTYRSLGNQEELILSGAGPILLRFDLSTAAKIGTLSKATLQLFSTKQYGDTNIGVFRCSQGHDLPDSEPLEGIAARYPGDKGISGHAAVVFATGFESEDWAEEWSYAGIKDAIDTVSEDSVHKFEPVQEKALRVKVAKGNTGALNTLYDFEKKTGSEPEEIYFRYYLRLGSDWNQTIQGGKMPGISGTYGVAGWGGRKVNGRDGWSARGLFRETIPENNPLGGLHPIGTYCYHVDMKGSYGSGWVWNEGYRGFLENNRWYAIEQYLKLNSPGKNDGILRAWVDGRRAFEKTDIRFRDIEKLKIEKIWMNVYHGGKLPSPHDQHLFIDNVVVAKEYIGPMKRD